MRWLYGAVLCLVAMLVFSDQRANAATPFNTYDGPTVALVQPNQPTASGVADCKNGVCPIHADPGTVVRASGPHQFCQCATPCFAVAQGKQYQETQLCRSKQRHRHVSKTATNCPNGRCPRTVRVVSRR